MGFLQKENRDAPGSEVEFAIRIRKHGVW